MAQKLSLPHERRKAQLSAAKIQTRVRIAEQREKLQRISTELAAMKPPKKRAEQI